MTMQKTIAQFNSIGKNFRPLRSTHVVLNGTAKSIVKVAILADDMPGKVSHITRPLTEKVTNAIITQINSQSILSILGWMTRKTPTQPMQTAAN